MKVDLKKYAINKPFIQDWYRKNNQKNILEVINIWGPTIHCPYVALAFYLAEDVGYIPELIELIDRLIAFYGYTEIQNQPEGSPYLTLYGGNDIKK